MSMIPDPPAGLSDAATLLWQQAHELADLDGVQRSLLHVALQAHDAAAKLAASLEGQPVARETKWGSRLNPLVRQLLRHQVIFSKGLRSLGLSALIPGDLAPVLHTAK